MGIVYVGRSKSVKRFKIKTEGEREILRKARDKFNGINVDFCSKILERFFTNSNHAGGYLCRIESGYTSLTLDQWENLKNYATNSE